MPNKTYEKHKGEGGIHGIEYQVKLLEWFLLKACENNEDFLLSTENKKHANFEDVVLETENLDILGQVKHKLNKETSLGMQSFFYSKRYGLRTYLNSFIKLYRDIFNKLDTIIKRIEKNKERKKNDKSYDPQNSGLNDEIICITIIKDSLKEMKNFFINNHSSFEIEVAELKEALTEFNITDDDLKIACEIISTFFKDKRYILFVSSSVETCTKKDYMTDTVASRILSSFNINDKDVQCYSFKKDSTMNKLQAVIKEEKETKRNRSEENNNLETSEESNVTNDIIEHFLKKFFVIIIKDEKIDEMIEESIKRNPHNKTITREYFDKKFYSWFKDIDGYYLQNIHFLSFFCESETECLVQKLKSFDEKFKLGDCSILNQFGKKSVLVIKTKREFLLMISILQQLRQSNVSNFLLLTDLNSDFHCKVIDVFEFCEYKKYLICVLKEFKPEFVKRVNDMLNNIAQTDKKVIFLSEKEIPLKRSFKLINDDKMFISCATIEIPERPSLKKPQNYILRQLLFNNESIFDNKLIQSTIENKEKYCTLISDDAGMGKTFLFQYFIDYVNEKCPNMWPIYIKINQYSQLLADTSNSKSKLLLEHFLELKDTFSQQVFTIPNIIVLFIELDEMDQAYQELTLEFLETVCNQENIKHLFLSIRPGSFQDKLTENVKIVLKTYKLNRLSHEDQYDFMLTYCKCDSNEAQQSFRLYSSEFLNKLRGLINNFDRFVEIPLLLRTTAKFFSDNIEAKMNVEDIDINALMERTLEAIREHVLIKSEVNNNEIAKIVFNRGLTVIIKDLENFGAISLSRKSCCNCINTDKHSIDKSNQELLECLGLLNGSELALHILVEYLIAKVKMEQGTQNQDNDFGDHNCCNISVFMNELKKKGQTNHSNL